MDKFAQDARYWTVKIEDRKDGFIGVKVFRERFGETTEAAEVIYWDACGGITVQTMSGDVPIEVIDVAAAEVRDLSSE